MPDPTSTQIATLIGGQDRLAQTVDGLRTDMQALVQGLTLMVESQVVQTDMLQQVMSLAAPDPADENPLGTLISEMTNTLDKQATEIRGLRQSVTGLGQRIAGAVIRGAGPADATETEALEQAD